MGESPLAFAMFFIYFSSIRSGFDLSYRRGILKHRFNNETSVIDGSSLCLI